MQSRRVAFASDTFRNAANAHRVVVTKRRLVRARTLCSHLPGREVTCASEEQRQICWAVSTRLAELGRRERGRDHAVSRLVCLNREALPP
eukprot:87939-Pleurochrysis_carterae.AAC.2